VVSGLPGVAMIAVGSAPGGPGVVSGLQGAAMIAVGSASVPEGSFPGQPGTAIIDSAPHAQPSMAERGL